MSFHQVLNGFNHGLHGFYGFFLNADSFDWLRTGTLISLINGLVLTRTQEEFRRGFLPQRRKGTKKNR